MMRQVFTAYDRGDALASRYNHCPSCGTPLGFSAGSDTRKAICAHCGSEWFRNPAPGVAILIVEDDRVLLAKRAEGSFANGKWCLPGGFIEFNEDFLTAAVREVYEETHLDVEIQSIINVVSNFLAPHLHTLVIVLLARLRGGQPIPGDDVQEIKWFPLNDSLPEMAFEADRYIIEASRTKNVNGLAVDPRYAGKKAT